MFWLQGVVFLLRLFVFSVNVHVQAQVLPVSTRSGELIQDHIGIVCLVLRPLVATERVSRSLWRRSFYWDTL